jgi:hypothetical protein
MKNKFLLSILSIALLTACATSETAQQDEQQQQISQQETQQPVGQQQETTEQVVFQSTKEDAPAEAVEIYYICYNNDKKPSMAISIKHIDGKAREVKYKGQTESMKLVYKKEKYMEGGAHPTIEDYYDEMYNGKVNGTYKLTHSGVWDYAEYTRAKDGKVFNFTINHDVPQYEGAPCF